VGVCAGSSIVESVFLLMVCRPALVCRALVFLPNFLSFPRQGWKISLGKNLRKRWRTRAHKNYRPKYLNLNCSTYWPVVGLIYLRFLGACFEPLMSRASAKVCPAASKRSLMQTETASKSDLSHAWPRKRAQGWKWSAST